MKRTLTTILVSFIYISFFGQDSFTLENIWNGSFSPKYLEEIHHLNNGNSYTVLEQDYNAASSQIKVKNYRNEDESILLKSSEAGTPYFDSYEFSEDEKKVILTYNSTPRYRYSSSSNAVVYDFDSKKSVEISSKQIINPQLSPDGSMLAYVLNNNIFTKDLNTLKTTQITFDGEINSIINGLTDWVYEEEFELIAAFKWSPDSKKIAYLKFDESKVPQYAMPIYGQTNYPNFQTFKYPKAGENNSKVTAHLYELENNKTTPIEFQENPYYIPRLQWRNNSEIAFQTLNRHQNHLNIYSYHLNDHKSKIIYEEKNDTYIEIDNYLSFLENDSFYFTSEKNGFNHIYLIDKKGKELPITSGNWEVTELYDFNIENNTFYFQANKGSEIERHIFSIDLNKKLSQLTVEKGTHEASFNKNQSLFIDTYSSIQTPPTFNLVDSKTSKVIRNLKNNKLLSSKIAAENLPIKEFRQLDIDGYPLNYYILKPKNFNSSKKYPVLLFQYSGPGSQSVKNSWSSYNDYWHQFLTKKGYVIACIDGRGTGGKGAEFKKLTQLQLGKLEAEDQISFAKHLGKLEFIDADRIGIWGWSFGGFTALNAILKNNSIFKAAIAVAPVTHWGFYDTIYTERFLKTPQENSEGYNDNSPITYANNLNCDLLLVHGSADDNVHLQNSLELSAAFVKFNKAFDQEIYTNKNHGIYGGKTRLHLFSKMTTFLMEKL